ncbi:MAG: DUF2807 domain-containing protein [Bacteroidetes bacterium]|nr:DUF2807 domain-containing protein [Bacteroidota bacterium]
MKKLIPSTLVVMLITSMALACQSFSASKLNPDSKDFPIQAFNAVSVGGAFEVQFTQGANTTARAEGSADDLANVVMEVKDNELTISTKKNSNIKHVTIYLSTPELNKIGIAGSGTFKTLNTLTTNKTLHVEIAGSGTITATIDAQDVEAEIAGSGDINLFGKSTNSDIEIAGSGNYKAQDLTTGNADVEIAGSGSVYLQASGKLDAEIAGSGSVYYKGQPSAIDKSVAGSGRIKQMD